MECTAEKLRLPSLDGSILAIQRHYEKTQACKEEIWADECTTELVGLPAFVRQRRIDECKTRKQIQATGSSRGPTFTYSGSPGRRTRSSSSSSSSYETSDSASVHSDSTDDTDTDSIPSTRKPNKIEPIADLA